LDLPHPLTKRVTKVFALWLFGNQDNSVQMVMLQSVMPCYAHLFQDIPGLPGLVLHNISIDIHENMHM